MKVSALTPLLRPDAPERGKRDAAERLRGLLRQARELGAHLHIDTESLDSRDAVLELVLELLAEEEFREGPSAGMVLQAYLRDSPQTLDQIEAWLTGAGAARTTPLTVRLVKGAYWDHEIVEARQHGWVSPVFDVKADSDRNFEQLTRRLLDSRTRGCGFASPPPAQSALGRPRRRLQPPRRRRGPGPRAAGPPRPRRPAAGGDRRPGPARARLLPGRRPRGRDGLPRAPAAREHLQRLVPGRPGPRRVDRGAPGATRGGGEPGEVIAGADSGEAREPPRRGRMGPPAGWALGAARERFEAALEETPEALEGLSWAAWWLDDGATVFAAREGAYRLYGRRGDAAAAARMATWLAADQLDFAGAWSVAGGWLRRAHRLLDGLAPSPEHGWLAFHEGYLAHAGGDTATARELASAAAEAGRRFGVADLEMLGLALEGATLVGCARVGEGMDRLDEATATALGGEAAIPISGAWTFCIMVGACTAALDFERAGEWIARIAGFAERFGSRYMLAFCRAEYGAVHLWGGRWDEAEAMLEASVEDYARSRPAWVGGPLVALAELRRRQGRATDAEALLERAGASRGRTCAARASRWTAGSRGRRSTCSSGCCVSSRPSAASTARRRSSCSCTPGWRAASSTRPARRPRRCARSRARWGPRRCARVPTGRGRARVRPRRARSRPRTARGRGRRPRARRRTVRGRAGAPRAGDVPARARP